MNNLKGVSPTDIEEDQKAREVLGLEPYDPVYDKDYIDNLIAKSNNEWDGVDADKWLRELRGKFKELK